MEIIRATTTKTTVTNDRYTIIDLRFELGKKLSYRQIQISKSLIKGGLYLCTFCSFGVLLIDNVPTTFFKPFDSNNITIPNVSFFRHSTKS